MTQSSAGPALSASWRFREDGSLLVTLPTALIRQRLANPVLTPPWDGMPVTLSHVRHALISQSYRECPLPESCSTPEDHASRIAWLMHHGWDDPIEVDIGIEGHGCHTTWPIRDGNHRLYAAILLRRPAMETLLDGSIDEAVDLFDIHHALLDDFDAMAA